jgi:hypothetical protein
MIVDEKGVAHPSMGDNVTPWGNAHISTCPECYYRFNGGQVSGRALNVATSGAQAEAMLNDGAEFVVVVRVKNAKE